MDRPARQRASTVHAPTALAATTAKEDSLGDLLPLISNEWSPLHSTTTVSDRRPRSVPPGNVTAEPRPRAASAMLALESPTTTGSTDLVIRSASHLQAMHLSADAATAAAMVAKARAVSEELHSLISRQELLLVQSAGTAAALYGEAAGSQALVPTKLSPTSLSEWMRIQATINRKTAALTMANSMAAMSASFHRHKLVAALEASRTVVVGLQSQIAHLESNLVAVTSQVTLTDERNTRLKTGFDSLRRTCDEALIHYRRESEHQRQLLATHDATLAALSRQHTSYRTVLGIVFFISSYLATGLVAPVAQLAVRGVLPRKLVRRNRAATLVWLLRLAVAGKLASVMATATGDGASVLMDWLVGKRRSG
ncbi:hypothetical protein BC828DRAFT_386314 [Blastocladiella britannica]|nr:hypothetical protein BC828DRAFT_386314 [Blastocladiella britannica]